MIPERLKYDISSKINSGVYSHDKRFPTLRQLCQEYSVSIATARKAVDMLKDDGVLISYQGHGTYLADSLSNRTRNNKKMIGLGHLMWGQDFLWNLSNDWLSKGWLITFYNSVIDHQDNDLERKFLKRAYDEEFTGVVLHPTPLNGGNQEYCRQLRIKGMKIAFLSQLDEEDVPQCAFLLDHEHAGYQAITQMALCGYKHFVYCHQDIDSVYVKKELCGIREAVDEYGFNLLDEIVLPNWTAKADTYESRTRMLVGNNRGIIDRFAELPQETAIIVNQNDVADVICGLLKQSGRVVSSDLGVCYCNNTSQNIDNTIVSGMEFPRLKQMQRSLEWIADENNKPSDHYIEKFKPTFIFRETSRKRITI